MEPFYPPPPPLCNIRANGGVRRKYQDLKGKTQGPFSQSRMREWHLQDYFARDLLVMPIPPGIGFLPVGSFFPDWTRAFEAVT